MRYAVVVIALIAVGCGHTRHPLASPDKVLTFLRAAHLDARRVTITISGSARQGSLGFSEALLRESDLKYFPQATIAVEHGRALVYVFASAKGARKYAGLTNGYGTRVRNVVVMTGARPLSPRLRRALERLP